MDYTVAELLLELLLERLDKIIKYQTKPLSFCPSPKQLLQSLFGIVLNQNVKV